MAKAATKPVPVEVEEDDIPSIVEFSVDLNDQEAPVPLPIREYPATITAARKKLSQKGTQYAEILFMIKADDYPADYEEGNPNGTVIAYRRVSLEDNPTARYATKKFLEAIGAPLGKRINMDDWVGLDAAVDITHEEYEGVNRAVINRVRAA